jgi:broad specificity phosphatase PhoE
MAATSFVEGVREALVEGPAIVVLRHAARHEITSAEFGAALRTPLTDEGREQARALGAALPGERPVRLWHSPVPRCADTAERLVEGLRARGADAGVEGARAFLGADYVHDADGVVRRFATLGQRRFVRAWAGGELGPELIDPPATAGRRVLGLLLELRDDDRALHLHVTHDLTLVALLALVCDVGAPEFPWPGFLDGVVLAVRPDDIRWRYGATRHATDRAGVVVPA